MLDMTYVTIQVCSIKIHNKANIEFLYKEKSLWEISEISVIPMPNAAKTLFFEDEQMEDTEILWMVKTSNTF